MNPITTKAFAKINLALEVLYKRPDNYHEINSIFTKINLYDKITIENCEQTEVVCIPPQNFDQQSNIAYKAVTLLKKYFQDDNLNVRITIQKNIPIGAGLGGGSSDAAAVLNTLPQIWNKHIEYNDLIKIASEIGSDVPFFINNPNSSSLTALTSGRGEILEFIDFQLKSKVLLVYPNIHVSTPQAYKMLNRTNVPSKGSDFADLIKNIGNMPDQYQKYFRNDFEKAIFTLHPEIGQIKNLMLSEGAEFALMSGSGSSVFGLYSDDKALNKSAGLLNKYSTYICDPF